MAIVIHRTPWTRQPQVPIGINKSNPLTPKWMTAWTPTMPQGIGDYRFTKTGSAAGTGSQNGVAIALDTSTYFATGPVDLPVGQWTLAVVMRCGSTWSDGAYCTGFCHAPGSGVFDRQITSFGSKWSGYLYDGAQKFASTTRTIVAYEWARIVVTTDGSTMWTYVDNGEPGSVAVSNSGYTGYSAPEFVIANSSSVIPADSVQHALVFLTESTWTRGMAESWIANPWQIFTPLQRRIWVPSVAAVGGIIGPLIGGSHLLTNGPLVNGRLAA